MKQTLLATVAAVALAFPAMAQGGSAPAIDAQPQAQQGQYQQNGGIERGAAAQPGQAGQAMPGAMPDAQQQQQFGQIDAEQLSNQQVTEIQQELSQQGFDVEVDGKWGPRTEAALKEFQEQRNLSAASPGQLDHQTLAELGVEVDGVGTTGAGVGTTGAGMPDAQPELDAQPQPGVQPTPDAGAAGQQDGEIGERSGDAIR